MEASEGGKLQVLQALEQHMERGRAAEAALRAAMAAVAAAKPGDRSDVDRHYAVVTTDLEKVFAYFMVYARSL